MYVTIITGLLDNVIMYMYLFNNYQILINYDDIPYRTLLVPQSGYELYIFLTV